MGFFLPLCKLTPFFKRSRSRKGVQRLLLFVLKKWGIGVKWARGRDPAGGARPVRTISDGAKAPRPEIQVFRRSALAGPQRQLPEWSWGPASPTAQTQSSRPMEACPYSPRSAATVLSPSSALCGASTGPMRACSADLECPRAQPISRFPPLFQRSLLPFPESLRSSLPPGPPEPAPSLRGLREILPGPQPPEIFLRSVSQDLGG